jgi:hypothetical protein
MKSKIHRLELLLIKPHSHSPHPAETRPLGAHPRLCWVPVSDIDIPERRPLLRKVLRWRLLLLGLGLGLRLGRSGQWLRLGDNLAVDGDALGLSLLLLLIRLDRLLLL